MSKELQVVTEKELKAYVNSACQSFKIAPSQMAPAEIEKFGIICNTMNLSPLKREIYAIPFKDFSTGAHKFQIVVGYEVYLKRATRSGKLKGFKVRTEGTLTASKIDKGNGQYAKKVDVWRGDLKAIVEIHVAGWSHPFEWEVNFEEYTQDNSMWFNKPHTMLKKVAMAQGFRLAFPDEIDGLPYTSDEMPDKGPAYDVSDIADVNQAEPELKPKKSKSKQEVVTPDYEEETIPTEPVEVQNIPVEEVMEEAIEAEVVIDNESVEDQMSLELLGKIKDVKTESDLVQACKEFGSRYNIKITDNKGLKEIYTVAKYFLSNDKEVECVMSGVSYTRLAGSMLIAMNQL